MVHKPKHKVHSFRGLLGDGGQNEIHLERQNVNRAFRIVKFQVMGEEPGGAVGYESIIKVWKSEQTTIDGVINFTDTDLLGVGMWSSSSDTKSYPDDMIVIFDREIFSRNIYITHSEIAGAGITDAKCNYYLELEEVTVTAATLMQLKLGVARKLDLKEGPYIPPV